MDEQIKRKNVNNEENSKRLRTKTATHKKYLHSFFDYFVEFQRNGRCHLTYTKKELGWKENHVIKISGIEDCKGNTRGHSFPCLKDKRPFDVRLTLRHVPRLGRFNSR